MSKSTKLRYWPGTRGGTCPVLKKEDLNQPGSIQSALWDGDDRESRKAERRELIDARLGENDARVKRRSEASDETFLR